MSPALRRYLPLLVVLVVQALFVAFLPSTAGTGGSATTAAPSSFESPFATTAPSESVPADGGTAPPITDATGATVATQPPVTSADGSPAPTTSGPGAPSAPVAGDTSHCVAGRQFDPAIDYFAPPCVPAFTGTNSGATYTGVTADTITLLDYIGQPNAAVEASLRAQGLYVSPEEEREWVAGVADFINSHYELYGRTVEIVVYEGQCSTIPPDEQCLREEMKRIAIEEKPFMFQWITPLTSAPYDELSDLGIINVGGQMFMDSFAQARRPFHWDVHMSGTQIAQHVGNWWCAQLEGDTAKYSPSPTPNGTPGNTNGAERVLGIIGTNDPQNIEMREEIDRVLRGCGSRVAHSFDAANDLSTAATQKRASVASMRQDPESTTVLCLCNPVGAQFVYQEMQQQNYYPEIIYAGTVYTDLDDTGQSFMRSSGCPSESNCNFEMAFGLSSTEPREPVGRDRAQRVWTASGRDGAPPFTGAELAWDYWSLMASLLQGAGPDLNPANVEQGAYAAGFRGGGDTGHALRGFEPGVYAWNRDMAITYWDPDQTSPFNGAPGTFIRLGTRLRPNEYGPNLPDIPVARR